MDINDFNMSCTVYKYLSNLKPYDYEKNYLILLFLAIACLGFTLQMYGTLNNGQIIAIKVSVPEADIDYWD